MGRALGASWAILFLGGCQLIIDPGSIRPHSPTGLSYDEEVAVYTTGVAVLNTPATTGGPIESYSIAPKLPAGLSLDASTGVISGIPVQVSPTTSYHVT